MTGTPIMKSKKNKKKTKKKKRSYGCRFCWKNKQIKS